MMGPQPRIHATSLAVIAIGSGLLACASTAPLDPPPVEHNSLVVDYEGRTDDSSSDDGKSKRRAPKVGQARAEDARNAAPRDVIDDAIKVTMEEYVVKELPASAPHRPGMLERLANAFAQEARTGGGDEARQKEIKYRSLLLTEHADYVHTDRVLYQLGRAHERMGAFAVALATYKDVRCSVRPAIARRRSQ